MNTSMPGQSNVQNMSDVWGTPTEAIAKRIADFTTHIANGTRTAVLAGAGSEEAATAASEAAVKAYAACVAGASWLIGSPSGDYRYAGTSIVHAIPYVPNAVKFALDSFKASGVDNAKAHQAAAARSAMAVENLGAAVPERLAIVLAAVAGAAAAHRVTAAASTSAPATTATKEKK